MLPLVEKLLVLQDRDRHLHHARAELASLAQERQSIQGRTDGAQAALLAARERGRQNESSRKKLELDAQAQQQLINKYADQQLQTRKNEEYRALGDQIGHCKTVITQLEDQQLEIMEQGEKLQREVATATACFQEAKKLLDAQSLAIDEREKNLKKQLAEYEAQRAAAGSEVEEEMFERYERLLKTKGDNVIVGVPNNVCGGCHMTLPMQVILSCKAGTDLNFCPHCGRVLYFTRDMEGIPA
jgi:predicted  nucleic acid-binding Zn-ribbon protein